MVFWPPTRGALTNTSLLAVAQTLQSLGVPLPTGADAHVLGNATDESGAITLAWALALDRASLNAPRLTRARLLFSRAFAGTSFATRAAP